MKILGISCFYHDAAAALLIDGKLVAAAEEERFSRKKHDASFPQHAVAFCLTQGNLQSSELDWVVFYEKPFPKFERILLTSLATYPQTWRFFIEALREWLFSKLWIRSTISHELQVPIDKILFADHHLSHAASAYYCSPFEHAATLTIDGVGEWSTATIGHGIDSKLTLLSEMRFPHSLGLLYSVFTAYLGFEINDGEYKVMGMAPYGTPRYVDKVRTLFRQFPDGSIHLDLSYFTYHTSPTKAFGRKFAQLFGPPRNPKSLFFTKASGFPRYFGKKPKDFDSLAVKNQHYADIAASIQKVTEEVMLAMAKHALALTGEKSLCLAGGVALNSVGNGILHKELGVNLYVQPAAGDGGGALGAALYVYHHLLNGQRSFVMEHAYWGLEYSDGEIQEFLDSHTIPYTYIKEEKRLIDRVVSSLLKKHIVGWFQGRFEWGPRALGNRSILADPRHQDMKDIVNAKIKFREPYRPFAPSVLVEKASAYFELADAVDSYPARYMLLVCPVKKEYADKLPAITHVDGSARIQTVYKKTNPRYHKLIQAFGKKTGIYVLLNTSFNLKGEPIVNTPANAFNTFMKSEMDVLVLGNCVVEKSKLTGYNFPQG